MTRARLAVACLLLGLVVLLWGRAANAQLLSPGPLSRAHAEVEGDTRCSECHASGRRIETSACLRCHADLGARIDAGKGLHGRQYRSKACETCHVEHLGRDARLVRWPGGDPKALDHALTGWALTGAHKPVGCAKCHDKRNTRGASTYLGLSQDCASCHKDPHDNRFGETCTKCHDDTSWKNVDTKQFDHNLSRFPLRGAHQKTACAKCHGDPAKYKGLEFASCASCHKDPHAGRLGKGCTSCHNEADWKRVAFDAGAHPGLSLGGGHARVPCRQCHDKGSLVAPSKGAECAACHKPVHEAPFGRNCAACHASITWLGLPRATGLGAHGRTKFPLTGRHVQASCAGCHRPELERNARYRKLPFQRCGDCHKDAHAGEFASRQGGAECAPCHTTEGFRPARFGVELHAATKFPLTGLHTATACSGCHGAARPRTNLHVTKQACADCHQNPHGTQFATEMAKGGCATCHEPAGWRRGKIDHSIWPLTGAHANAQCESCHEPSTADRANLKGATYRGVPRQCSKCHDDAHAGQFQLSAPAHECERCHVTQSFKIPSFDHAGITGFALTGKHESVQCGKCHTPAALQTGGETVRWRLPSTECRYCHANPHTRRDK